MTNKEKQLDMVDWIEQQDKRYEVQQYTIVDGWINTWTVDDEPEYFSSADEARKEIDEFLSDTDELDGVSSYDPADFRVYDLVTKTTIDI